MKTKAPPLLPLFRSAAQARILERIFAERDEVGVSLSGLVAETGIPAATVHREIGRLEEAGLVASSRVGRERRVAANPSSPFYPELRSLVRKAFGPVAVLRARLADVPGVRRAYVFGSWARRYRGDEGPAPLDVDLLVIGEPDPDAVYDACRDAERDLGLAVDPTILTEAEWEQAGTGFLRAIREGPLIEVL